MDTEDVTDKVDEATEEIPESTVTEEPESPKEEHKETESRPSWVDEIIHAINGLKEESPVTPVEEEILDETPVKRPWTHRGFKG